MTDEEVIDVFFTKELGILYTKKFNLFEKTHEPLEVYEYLKNRFKDSKSIKESLYRLKFNHIERPVCPVCGNELDFLGKPSRMWKTYCSNKCRYSEIRQEKFRNTCKEKYGVEYVQQTKELKDKAKETCLRKYGVEHYTNREKFFNTCKERYGVKTNLNIPKTIEYTKQHNKEHKQEIRQKIKETCKERYGVECSLSSPSIRQKIKETCLERYGVEFASQSNEFKDKLKRTCLERYGVTNGGGSKEAQEKIKKTCLERYGVTNGGGTKEAQEKIRQTTLKNYGVEYFWQSEKLKEYMKENQELIQAKINNTKKKNHTFNTSRPEEELYLYIKEKFPEVKRQYRDKERYPYCCDFYVPSLDYFIELQGHWTHGKHSYNKNSIEDQDKVEEWKSKHTRFYDNAITIWTIKDPEKRECAKKHNLNFKEVWSLDEGKEFVDTIFNKSKDNKILN